MGGLLFEIDALDPLTFLGVPLVLAAAALLAAYLPARRASRVQSRRRASDRRRRSVSVVTADASHRYGMNAQAVHRGVVPDPARTRRSRRGTVRLDDATMNPTPTVVEAAGAVTVG